MLDVVGSCRYKGSRRRGLGSLARGLGWGVSSVFPAGGSARGRCLTRFAEHKLGRQVGFFRVARDVRKVPFTAVDQEHLDSLFFER